jgi:thiol:disulfide interchange protein
MSARLILHIILTLILFALGWWLYLRIGDAGAFGSVEVAKYWFAILVYVFFSWIFYWIVHRLRLRAWFIMQFLAILIAAISTSALLYISREHQEKIEQKAMQQQEDLNSIAEQEVGSVSENKEEDLSLSEEGEFNESETSQSENVN